MSTLTGEKKRGQMVQNLARGPRSSLTDGATNQWSRIRESLSIAAAKWRRGLFLFSSSSSVCVKDHYGCFLLFLLAIK